MTHTSMTEAGANPASNWVQAPRCCVDGRTRPMLQGGHRLLGGAGIARFWMGKATPPPAEARRGV